MDPARSGWGSFAAFAVALACVTGNAVAAGPVRLRSGTVDRPAGDARFPASLRGPVVLEFDRPVGPDTRRAAALQGIELDLYLGNGAFLAEVPPGGLLSTIPGLSWAAPYEPRLKIAPEIAALARGADERVPVTLHLLPRSDSTAIAARLLALGLQPLGLSPGKPPAGGASGRPGKIVLVASASRIAELRETIARWPETLWLARRPVYRLLNDTSVWVGQSGLDGGHATPVHDHGILGQGQVIGILDTGLDADMCFFRDPALGLPPVHQGLSAGTPDFAQRKVGIVNFLWSAESPSDPMDWDTQDHGTHVAGSAAGDDFATPGQRDAADGMAPAAKLVIQDGGYGVDNCADLPAIGCPAADLYPFFEQAWLEGARIHSNSYGDRENFTPYDIYSEGSEAADAFMWDHPDFLLVFAAGNNGPGANTVASPATAKNVLAVGATLRGDSAGSLASFSSRGPTHDGRIKPDVTAPGSGIISANNDLSVNTFNCGTKSSSGTSMACPTAAGFAALVRQYYEEGFYPGGAVQAQAGFLPSAALVKATLIASAKAMEAVSAPPPSSAQGWGRVLLDDALYFTGDAVRLYAADRPARFDSPSQAPDEHLLDVLDSSHELRVVLTWTDYPATPGVAIDLVNDLDLEVESPAGAIYRGNVFSGGTSQTGGSADRLNNVEAVRIPSPQIGTWIARVRPHAIPQPAQGYALVATARIPAGVVSLERKSLSIDDAPGGNANGIIEPGEWIDFPLALVNNGGGTAANARVQVESLTAGVEVVQAESAIGAIGPGQTAGTSAPHLRIRVSASFVCSAPLALRFVYLADGYTRSEDATFPTGGESVIRTDDFEGTTLWQYVPAESTAATGAWTLGDPDGTAYQPEDDASPAPGTRCLFTAPNAGGESTDDVDGGVVVARSGAYDLAGHPEARLRISRWFGNRDMGEDTGDFFRLEIRTGLAAPDVLLEQLGTNVSAPRWTERDFRIADFVAPGPTISLRVSAADGTAATNVVEAAIDEIVFWEPACQVHDPPPNPVRDLRARRAGADVVLGWSRPVPDPAHGEATSYRVFRSNGPTTGAALRATLQDASPSVSWTDSGAIDAAASFYYLVIAANPAGAAEPDP